MWGGNLLYIMEAAALVCMSPCIALWVMILVQSWRFWKQQVTPHSPRRVFKL